jgi:hypothetical protein
MSRGRKIAVWVLLVVGALLGLIGILTVWVDRQMLDDHAWNKASRQVIENREVQASLASFMVNTLYDNVDVQGALEQRLPSNAKTLAGPLASALRQPATNTAQFILGRPRFQELWITTMSVAHDKLVNVLENKTGSGISTGSGVVTLDLKELVKELASELGLPAPTFERLPPETGKITLLKSDQLGAAQTGVRILKILSAWLLIAVLVLFAVAIYIARGARRVTLRNVGWAFVIVGLIVLVVRRWLGNYLVDNLASETYGHVMHVVYLIETSILGQIGGASVAYGIVVILGAVLAGPTRAATTVRRWIAPVLNHRPGVAAGAVGVVYLLLVLWGPTHALRKWWGILLLAGLLALGVYMLRRQTLEEFPDTAPAPEPPTLAGPPPADAT